MDEYQINIQHEITLPSAGIYLNGLLYIPSDVQAIIIFAHGSGSSRLSKRNQYVAQDLQKINMATLLFDLLTLQEETTDARTAQYRFDIELLANRLLSVTNWVLKNQTLRKLPIGYYGASTGAAAALLAAASERDLVKAIVSRGGRPDLAGKAALAKVKAATLLIVGGDDTQVIELNNQAYTLLQCEKKLEIVPGATHLFEEPGKLDEVVKLTRAWFKKHLIS